MPELCFRGQFCRAVSPWRRDVAWTGGRCWSRGAGPHASVAPAKFGGRRRPKQKKGGVRVWSRFSLAGALRPGFDDRFEQEPD